MLSFKNVDGLNFQDAYGMLEVLIANLCKKYVFLLESENTDLEDKAIFNQLRAQRADKQNLKDSLVLLTRMMAAYYGKPTILLIDEYDVPLDKAHRNDYYNEMLDVIRAIMGSALKTNPYL